MQLTLHQLYPIHKHVTERLVVIGVQNRSKVATVDALLPSG